MGSRSSSDAGAEVLEEFGGSTSSQTPGPKLQKEELMEVPEDGISEDFLQRHCGTTDLASVTYLDVQLDTVVQNIDSLGVCLPRLRHLRLSNSSIMSIRELGIGLDHLEVLWMSRCGLQELDGIAIIPALQELYLPFNDIADVSQLKWLECLSVLDLEGNALNSFDELEELMRCHQLRDLTLVGNPICQLPEFSIEAVLKLLPQVSMLNDLPREVCASSQTLALSSDDIDPGIFLDMYMDSDMPLYLDLYLGHRRASANEDLGTDANDTECGPGTPRGPEDCSHPLMVQGLRDSPWTRGEGNEPTEQQLVMERLKRMGSAQVKHSVAHTPEWAATSPTPQPPFGLQMPARRQSLGQEPAPRGSLTTPRGGAACGSVATPRGGGAHGAAAAVGLGLDDFLGQNPDAASDLTRGGQLAGNPLAAMRQRRNQASSGQTDQESDLGIRELLRRHRG